MSLAYPTGVGGGLSDFITFAPIQYRATARGGSAPVEAGAQSVTLYMPNSTPAVGNGQQWGDLSGFAGPLGAAKRDAGAALIGGMSDLASGTSISDRQSMFQRDLTRLGNNRDNLGNIAMQAGATMVAGGNARTANQLLAFSRGKVFNPNVELLYEQPLFRRFNFNFDFVPKNARETQDMNSIIKNFKEYSAPLDLENGMYEVPYVWQIVYHTGGGGPNSSMNRFKPAACVSVSVQANQATDMHVSHEDGSPIQTTMNLDFQEVEIITRRDHINAGGQGF